MKKLLLAALLGSTTLGMAQQKGMLHLEVELNDTSVKEITLLDEKGKTIKTITAKKEMLFIDDIKLKKASYYAIRYGEKTSYVFLKNNADLKMKFDDKELGFTYLGSLAPENSLGDKIQKAFSPDENEDLFKASNDKEFEEKLKAFTKAQKDQLSDPKLDPAFKKQNEPVFKYGGEYLKSCYKSSKLNNTMLPDFEFDNYKGGKSKLADFKGKYLYLDLWATWCGPCKEEIPSMKRVEEKYHGKNIEFISISLDNKAQAQELKGWKKMIEDKKMGGIQLIANKPLGKEAFAKSMIVSGIPRFILVGPDGKIIKSDAPRPSDPKLTEQLDKLLN